jgi:hypothetical protein
VCETCCVFQLLTNLTLALHVCTYVCVQAPQAQQGHQAQWALRVRLVTQVHLRPKAPRAQQVSE